MLKKLLLSFFVLLIFFVGVNPGYAKEYDNKILSNDDATKIQTEIKKNMTPEQLLSAQKYFKEQGNPMSIERIRTLLSDGKDGEVTRYFDKIVNGGDGVRKALGADGAGADGAGAEQNEESNKIADCDYDPESTGSGSDIRFVLEGCISNSTLVQPADLYVSGGLKDVLNGWIAKIAGFLALGAMFAIALGSLRLTLSMGEDENIKKAKDIIKWGILGFLAVISAGLLISTVVNLIYSLA